MMGNYHVRCGAGEKPEVLAPEAYLSLFALPDGFTSLLSTMRSRNISSIIIIQNLAQIKELFEKSWETIPGNCDTTVYLGGNEQETHKYISEMLGKQTIDKKSTGETKGKQGSSSNNYDVLGRELMLPDEVRKLDGKKCVVFIRGFNPILDDKIHTNKLPFWKEVNKIEKNYHFDARLKRASKAALRTSIHFYSEEELRGIHADELKEEEEYQTLCQLAEMGQEQKPEKPKPKIMNIRFDEMLSSYQQMGDVFDEEILFKNRENYLLKKNEGMNEKEEEEDSVAGHAISENSDFYDQLLMAGYDEDQANILEALADIPLEEVVESFPRENIPDILQLLVNDYLADAI